MDVVGYEICRVRDCQQLVLDVVAHATGGICTGCALEGLGEGVDRVDLAVEGARISVSKAPKPKTGRNRRQYLRRKGRPDVKARKHAAQKAAEAARKRLAALAPELYGLILADERQKRGLTPISAHQALRAGPGAVAWETLDLLAFYRALTPDEGAPDDPQHPTADASTSNARSPDES